MIDLPGMITAFVQPLFTGSLGSSSGSLGSLGSTSTGSLGSSYGSAVDAPGS
ncbi:hypothetical protein [Prescottella subtropica]|uniref:hypothetical protein n=1 Tax=Prescottella subtropica TaxID=2545757 RepID=UPI00138752F8|nr:hypothetical protein [Prescottella subtropica]